MPTRVLGKVNSGKKYFTVKTSVCYGLGCVLVLCCVFSYFWFWSQGKLCSVLSFIANTCTFRCFGAAVEARRRHSEGDDFHSCTCLGAPDRGSHCNNNSSDCSQAPTCSGLKASIC